MSTYNRNSSSFERLAHWAGQFTGSTTAFALALGIILGWIFSGSYFAYSDTWQLVINTGTTIVTFLMVFLIQRTQNKDSRALHLKLNELVAALKGPSNRLIDVEEMSEEELDTLSRYYAKLARLANLEKDLSVSHSIEEAKELHHKKYGRRKTRKSWKT